MTTIVNLSPNPSAEINISGWSAGGGASLSRSVGTAYSGDAAIQIVATATGVVSMFRAGGFAISTPYAMVSGWVYHNNGSDRTGHLRHASVNGPSRIFPSGEWTRINQLEANNAGTVSWLLQFTDAVIGDVFLLDANLVTEGDTLHDYFDGDSPNAEWTGTPHASTSVLTIPDTAPRPSRVFVLGSPHIGPLRIGG